MDMNEDVFHLGIKALIRNENGEILLLQVNKAKLKNSNTSEYWDIPGGRVQKGESPIDTLKREVEEETGIKEVSNIRSLMMVLSNIRIPITNEDSFGLILFVYTCNIPSNSNITISDEHINYNWFNVVEAARRLKIKYPTEFTDKIKSL